MRYARKSDFPEGFLPDPFEGIVVKVDPKYVTVDIGGPDPVLMLCSAGQPEQVGDVLGFLRFSEVNEGMVVRVEREVFNIVLPPHLREVEPRHPRGIHHRLLTSRL